MPRPRRFPLFVGSEADSVTSGISIGPEGDSDISETSIGSEADSDISETSIDSESSGLPNANDMFLLPNRRLTSSSSTYIVDLLPIIPLMAVLKLTL